MANDSRMTMIRAAERLFGERGIGAVSLREVAAAAGQGNNSAVRYHFGSRDGLVDAIFDERMARIDERRRAMLAGMGAAPDLRSLVEALVYPLAESIGHDDGVSWYARFLRQVAFQPGFDFFSPTREANTRGIRVVQEGIEGRAESLPVGLRALRVRRVFEVVVHGLADHEGHMAAGAALAPTPVVAADLVDTAVAVLEAAPSGETLQRLGRGVRRRMKVDVVGERTA